VARQILRDEMKKRGLDELRAASEASNRADHPAATVMDPSVDLPDPGEWDTGDAEQESDLPHDYTWKTLLCECEECEEAWQIHEVLRRAGIESWIEGSGTYSPYAHLDLRNPRILVAADRLDEARAIAARPIPQEIIEQSNMKEPDFEPPVCPNCGAGDPVLEGVGPANSWRCEACGNEWTESAEEAEQ
jgi:predicted nucleic acid-binding Zn ribbon protein